MPKSPDIADWRTLKKIVNRKGQEASEASTLKLREGVGGKPGAEVVVFSSKDIAKKNKTKRRK